MWYHEMSCDIIWYHMISYDLIWYHRFNLSESAVNQNKYFFQNFFIYFIFQKKKIDFKINLKKNKNNFWFNFHTKILRLRRYVFLNDFKNFTQFLSLLEKKILVRNGQLTLFSFKIRVRNRTNKNSNIFLFFKLE